MANKTIRVSDGYQGYIPLVVQDNGDGTYTLQAALAATPTIDIGEVQILGDDGAVLFGSKNTAAWDGAAASPTWTAIWKYISSKIEAVRALLAGVITVAGGQVVTSTATIASSASLSGAVDCSTGRLARIAMPSAWDAASLTFQTSFDGSAYSNLYDNQGTEYTVTAAASREIIIPLVDFIGIRYLKIRSGTSGTPVNQSSSRTLNVVILP